VSQPFAASASAGLSQSREHRNGIPQWHTPSANAEGWRIARWARANAAAVRITYVICDARIWSIAQADEGWRHYSHPTGAINPTLDHLDHVHMPVIGSWLSRTVGNHSLLQLTSSRCEANGPKGFGGRGRRTTVLERI
jgi:hypothetical protein